MKISEKLLFSKQTNVKPLAINEIPNHWGLCRAKYVFNAIDERSANGDEDLLSVSHITGVSPRSEKSINMFLAESYEGHKLCKPKDLVINSLWAWMKALGFSEYEGIVSTAYGVYRIKDEDAFNYKYLDYLLRSDFYGGEYLVRSKGIWTSRLLLSDDAFFNIPIIIPPRKEQDAIVKFLEERLTDIAQYIATKQKQIELLNEQKAAIINQAVTKGLYPNAKMKNSGVEWLGDVPEGWEIKPLKYWIYMNQKTLPEDTDLELEFEYLDIGNVLTGKLVGEIEKHKFINAPSRARRLVAEGDTIISTVRTYLKAVLYITKELSNYVVSTGFAVLTPRVTILPYFLFLAVQNHPFINTVTINSIGASYPAINPTKLGSLKLVAPSNTKEQAEIIKYIKSKVLFLDEAINGLYNEIKSINNYKNSLISEAVSGKIKIGN